MMCIDMAKMQNRLENGLKSGSPREPLHTIIVLHSEPSVTAAIIAYVQCILGMSSYPLGNHHCLFHESHYVRTLLVRNYGYPPNDCLVTCIFTELVDFT